MAKVLCKGGPYYWIVEPETEFERRLRAWEERHLDAQQRGKDRFTRAEYLKARREYSGKYWLPPGNSLSDDARGGACASDQVRQRAHHVLWRCAASA